MDRRRFLQAAGSSDYVQDGLILHLDGLNRGGNTGEWVNLVDGNIFTLDGNYTENDNGVTFASASLYTITIYEPVSVQFVINNRNNAFAALFHTNTRDKSIYTLTNGDLLFGVSNSENPGYTVATPHDQIISVSADFNGKNYDDPRINGAPVEKVKNPDRWASLYTGTKFGKYNNAYPFVGDILSIMFYDRQLTEAEKAKNFAVDMRRFNIE